LIEGREGYTRGCLYNAKYESENGAEEIRVENKIVDQSERADEDDSWSLDVVMGRMVLNPG
jgi:hypothetical protein